MSSTRASRLPTFSGGMGAAAPHIDAAVGNAPALLGLVRPVRSDSGIPPLKTPFLAYGAAPTSPECIAHAPPLKGGDPRSGTPLEGRGIRGSFGADGAALVTTAKSSAVFGAETTPPEGFDPVAARLERFSLQSATRKILPSSRTAKCLRYVQKGAKPHVWKSVKHGSAHYKNLQTCGSVWACPVCAAKISERRRAEVLAAINAHEAQGGQVLLLNLTFPHGMGDELYMLLGRMSKAVDYVLKGSWAAKKLYAQIGCIGTIRALEVTYGSNGYHPHFHILLFVNKGLDLLQAEANFFSLWERGCYLAKLGQPDRKRCPLQDGTHAAEYAAKGVWGLDREMTKGHIKKSRKGYSPFDLLRLYAFGTKPEGATFNLDKSKAARVFRVYAEAFKGRRQLVWSKGLKALFAIGDLSDDEISARVDDESIMLGQFELNDWRRVVAADGRGLVLELARTGGWDAVMLYLEGLPPHRGFVSDA